MPAWVTTAFKEYQKRLPKQCELELVEIPAKHRGKNADTVRILRDEAEAIKKVVGDHEKMIALDRKGKAVSTEKYADHLQQWIDENQDIAFVIGGPEGIAPDMLATAEYKWSLSAMTFAHPIGLPYHRGD